MNKILPIILAFFLLPNLSIAGIDWLSYDICKKSNIRITECNNIGKSAYRYNRYVKKDLKLGLIEGVVYIEKGKNRGTNERIAATYSGYYYLINDMNDKKNLITIWSLDSEVSVR